jgi:hypothetical protein
VAFGQLEHSECFVVAPFGLREDLPQRTAWRPTTSPVNAIPLSFHRGNRFVDVANKYGRGDAESREPRRSKQKTRLLVRVLGALFIHLIVVRPQASITHEQHASYSDEEQRRH